MNAAQFTTVDGAEELSQNTGLSFEQAMNLIEVAETREQMSGDTLYLVQISDWMAQQWENEHGVSSEYVLVESIEDYSAKAWLVEGGLLVTDDGLNDSDATLTSALTAVDHGTPEYERDKGTTWCAKSQTVNIINFA